MGRWGELFFEGDMDFEEASDISGDAGIELYYYELDAPGEEYKTGGKGSEATRDHLNDGVLSRLFKQYSNMKADDCFVGRELHLVFLGITD